jgi:hypothetical protein
MPVSEAVILWAVGGAIATLATLIAAIGRMFISNFKEQMRNLSDHLGGLAEKMESIDDKIGEILMKDAYRDAELNTMKATLYRLPCVRAGHKCPQPEND